MHPHLYGCVYTYIHVIEIWAKLYGDLEILCERRGLLSYTKSKYKIYSFLLPIIHSFIYFIWKNWKKKKKSFYHCVEAWRTKFSIRYRPKSLRDLIFFRRRNVNQTLWYSIKKIIVIYLHTIYDFRRVPAGLVIICQTFR